MSTNNKYDLTKMDREKLLELDSFPLGLQSGFVRTTCL